MRVAGFNAQPHLHMHAFLHYLHLLLLRHLLVACRWHKRLVSIETWGAQAVLLLCLCSSMLQSAKQQPT
jgi:hypothetical protein